jgi:propane 2-monooxygenase small subunit
VISSWLEVPIAESLSAARALEPIWSEAESTPGTFDEALTRARERVRGILDELDVPTPKELDR